MSSRALAPPTRPFPAAVDAAPVTSRSPTLGSASSEVRSVPNNALGTRDSQRPSLGSRLSSLVGRRSASSLGPDIVAVRPENCTAAGSGLTRPSQGSAASPKPLPPPPAPRLKVAEMFAPDRSAHQDGRPSSPTHSDAAEPQSSDPLRSQFADYAAHGSSEDDRHSAGSSSSGDRTKVGTPVEPRSPSQMYAKASSGASHGLPAGAGSDDYHNANAYPASPGSSGSHGNMPFGSRHRQDSYADSGFASTIGSGHHTPALYSSRTALNADGLEPLPGKEHMYAMGDSAGFDSGELMVLDSSAPHHGLGEKSYVPLPPPAAFDEKEKRPLGPDGARAPEPAVVLSRANRLAWIDGLRGLASIIIFTHQCVGVRCRAR